MASLNLRLLVGARKTSFDLLLASHPQEARRAPSVKSASSPQSPSRGGDPRRPVGLSGSGPGSPSGDADADTDCHSPPLWNDSGAGAGEDSDAAPSCLTMRMEMNPKKIKRCSLHCQLSSEPVQLAPGYDSCDCQSSASGSVLLLRALHSYSYH